MTAPVPLADTPGAAAGAPPDLQVLQLSKRYGAAAAVDGVSLAVAKGSFFSILGPSGCGKTTLLRMMAGFLQPDAGDIRIRGESVLHLPANRRPVNMVFQHLALFPMMNVQDNIGYGLARRGVAKADIRQRVGQMLERVGLPGVQHKRIDQLSGGQKQRVAIARSLVLEPTLLLLDEPLGALDLQLRERMKLELKQLQAQFATTFVYITHDQSEAMVMSDQVAVMNHGRFEQVGSPQTLYYEPQTPFVAGFVGTTNALRGRTQQAGVDRVRVCSDGGWVFGARARVPLAAGAGVQVFVRPESIRLARHAAELAPTGFEVHDAVVQSLLFDGANSSVFVRQGRGHTVLRVALPQTGELSGLVAGDAVVFGFDPQRALCFAA
jgi:spermidine/putrescine transport system ATP-binding protein